MDPLVVKGLSLLYQYSLIMLEFALDVCTNLIPLWPYFMIWELAQHIIVRHMKTVCNGVVWLVKQWWELNKSTFLDCMFIFPVIIVLHVFFDPFTAPYHKAGLRLCGLLQISPDECELVFQGAWHIPLERLLNEIKNISNS